MSESNSTSEEWILLGKDEKSCFYCQKTESKLTCSNCFFEECIQKIKKLENINKKIREKRALVQEQLQIDPKKQEKLNNILVKKIKNKNFRQQINKVQEKLNKDIQEIEFIKKKNKKKSQMIEESHRELQKIQQQLDISYQKDMETITNGLKFINDEIQYYIKNRIKNIFTTIHRIKLKGLYVIFDDVFMPTDGVYQYMYDIHILKGYESIISMIEIINRETGWIYPSMPRITQLRILEDDNNSFYLSDSFELVDRITNLKGKTNLKEMRDVSTNLNFSQDWKKKMNIDYQSITLVNQIIYDMAVYQLNLKNITPKEAPLNLFRIITHIISPDTILSIR